MCAVVDDAIYNSKKDQKTVIFIGFRDAAYMKFSFVIQNNQQLYSNTFILGKNNVNLIT